MIRQQEKNLAVDNQAIEALQQQQQSMFPDSTQSHSSSTAVSRAARPKQRPNQQKKNSQPNVGLMQRQINELQKLLSVFKNEAVNKSRVEPYTVVSFSDSKGRKGKLKVNNHKRSVRRKTLKTSITSNTRAHNERFITNLSNQALSDNEVNVLSRGLKFIPTPPVPTSHKSFLKDFNQFARTMRLKYMFVNKKKTKPHTFHVKSNWQPPIQPSAALEQYLEDTKLEIASMVFYPQSDNISQGERAAINALKKNDKLNLKKADKGTNTVILDTTQKIERV